MKAKQRTSRPKLRSSAEARKWLRENGVTVTAFAKQNKLCRHALNDALSGVGKGNFGKSHAAFVALGLKHDPNSCTKPSKPVRSGRSKSAKGKSA